MLTSTPTRLVCIAVMARNGPKAPKRRPGTTSGAPGESHVFVAVLFPLDLNRVAVVAQDGLGCAAMPTLPVAALTILTANVKVTSRAPFPRP